MKDGRILTLMVTTAVHYAGVKMVCPGLIGKASDNTLNTAPSAAYPPGMCMKLAGTLIQSWLDKMRKDECAPEVGVQRSGTLAPDAPLRYTSVETGAPPADTPEASGGSAAPTAAPATPPAPSLPSVPSVGEADVVDRVVTVVPSGCATPLVSSVGSGSMVDLRTAVAAALVEARRFASGLEEIGCRVAEQRRQSRLSA